MTGSPAEALRHPALEEGEGSALGAAAMTDRQRLGILLQATALLSHLDHAGWRLTRGWSEARVDASGILRSLSAEPGGTPGLPPQALLRELVSLLFRTEGSRVAGRGPARRAVRLLEEGWRQDLARVSPDRAVAQLLDSAPFLFEPAFAPARRALAGEHLRRGRRELWVAGPGPFRRRALASGRDRAGLEALLAGPGSAGLWRGTAPTEDPRQLVEAGRWRAALAVWSERPPAAAAERLAMARALFALGRFGRAREVLRGLRVGGAAALRAWCQYHLGELGAARRSLRRLGEARLSPEDLLEVADLALRVFANSGDFGQVAQWVERARKMALPELAPRAEILAALAAWDRGDPDRMGVHLEAAGRMVDDPAHAWRWYHARGLHAAVRGKGPEAARMVGRALRLGRRRLTRAQAGALWNDMVFARVAAGDLAGAERACLHSLWLLGGCEGPRKTTLALFNLAEVRLRRGRLVGVREILESSAAENRVSGNWRGAVQDTALQARLELMQGRTSAALARLREGLAELDRLGFDFHRAELQALAARALGWMGRSEEAGEALAAGAPAVTSVFEPEERPALWALAGERERALREVEEGAGGRLWRALLTAQAPPAAAWREIEDLEPYRAARLVYDAELVAPGTVPAGWLRRAIATLCRVGAWSLAERLEGREVGPWVALAGYLRRPEGPAALGELLAAAGYPEARLSVEREDREEVLVEARGGEEELMAPLAGGRLILRVPAVDPVLRTLFALALRDLPAAAGSAASGGRVGEGGMVGESPKLRQALARLAKLAPTEVPVLIVGETGTGKELAACHLHALSAQAKGPFLPINCAALGESLLLSDLFGHVRGAFTGADRDRAGVFETARGGTVFLDEIGDLPPSAQGMLLRVLQQGEVRRVGESVARRVDVRVVTATHRDLDRLVAEGAFRQDLFFRLKVGRVELPPLRERGGDLLLLAEHFLSRHRGPGGPPRLTAGARSKLLAHLWPGNVRELENVVAVAAAFAEGGRIDAPHLELPAGRPPAPYHQQLDEFRRHLVGEALAASGGNRAAAARRLGLSRQALSYLVRKLRLT